MLEYKVFCENPTTIFNPAVVDFIDRYQCHFVRNGKIFPIYFRQILGESYKIFGDTARRQLSKFFRNNDIAEIYNEDGECIRTLIEVPCGHCILCQHRKRKDFAVRCSLESQSYTSLPLFITLTYDDAHLPDGGLHYPDVQRFLKRIRVNLQRQHGFTDKLRYAMCGEYGKSTRRPHYHILLYNFPMLAFYNNLFEIDKYIRQIWSIGLTQTKLCSNADAGFYVGKYMTKQVLPNSTDTPPFHHASIRLGQQVVKGQIQYLYDNADCNSLEYYDKWLGKSRPLPMVKSFVNAFLPTRSKSIPMAFRNAFADFVTCLSNLRMRRGINTQYCCEQYAKRFEALGIKLPKSIRYISRCYEPISDVSTRIDEDFAIFERYAGKDFSNADFLHNRRNQYYTSLLMTSPTISVASEAYKVKNQLDIENSKNIFL